MKIALKLERNLCISDLKCAESAHFLSNNPVNKNIADKKLTTIVDPINLLSLKYGSDNNLGSYSSNTDAVLYFISQLIISTRSVIRFNSFAALKIMSGHTLVMARRAHIFFISYQWPSRGDS